MLQSTINVTFVVQFKLAILVLCCVFYMDDSGIDWAGRVAISGVHISYATLLHAFMMLHGLFHQHLE